MESKDYTYTFEALYKIDVLENVTLFMKLDKEVIKTIYLHDSWLTRFEKIVEANDEEKFMSFAKRLFDSANDKAHFADLPKN